MRIIKNLDIHAVHSCNLTCESCSHYSNHGHKGILSLDEAGRWMALWTRRILPRIFNLVGGEPTIHPHLAEFVSRARDYWPLASLRVWTNGFFLDRHPLLPLVLKNDHDACLVISIHHDAPEYQEKIQPIRDMVAGWVEEHGIRVEYRPSSQLWTRRYKGFGSTMEPFEDGQPRRSWEKCECRYSPQLLEGKIWKCPALAYLPMQDAKYHLSEKWQPYLQYRPLEPGCSDDQLREFFSLEEESFCGMCPADPPRLHLPLPLKLRSRSSEDRQRLVER